MARLDMQAQLCNLLIYGKLFCYSSPQPIHSFSFYRLKIFSSTFFLCQKMTVKEFSHFLMMMIIYHLGKHTVLTLNI